MAPFKLGLAIYVTAQARVFSSSDLSGLSAPKNAVDRLTGSELDTSKFGMSIRL